MLIVKNKILLKKSYEVRKLLDIFLNSNNIVFLHLDKFYGDSFEKFKQDLLIICKVSISLLNKDRILLSNFSFIAKGPTLVVYSDNFFYNDLINILEKNKISYEVLLIKSNSFISLEKLNVLTKKYNMSFSNVYTFFFFLVNFYKNILFFINYILKFYYKKIISILYNRVFVLFFLYKKILLINNIK